MEANRAVRTRHVKRTAAAGIEGARLLEDQNEAKIQRFLRKKEAVS